MTGPTKSPKDSFLPWKLIDKRLQTDAPQPDCHNDWAPIGGGCPKLTLNPSSAPSCVCCLRFHVCGRRLTKPIFRGFCKPEVISYKLFFLKGHRFYLFICWPCCEGFRILISSPGIKLVPPAVEVLTTGQPGKSLIFVFKVHIFLVWSL